MNIFFQKAKKDENVSDNIDRHLVQKKDYVTIKKKVMKILNWCPDAYIY